MSGDDGAKYIHCVEEPGQKQGSGDDGGAGGGGVVIEWARRAAAVAGGVDLQEVLVKCRVGQFPSRKSFYLIVSGARLCGQLSVREGDACKKNQALQQFAVFLTCAPCRR